MVDDRDLAQEDDTLFPKEIYKDKEEERFVIKVDKESGKKIIKQESIKRKEAIFRANNQGPNKVSIQY